MNVLVNILKEIGKAILISLFTEAFVKELVVSFLEWLAKKTDNSVDDRLIAAVRNAMEKSNTDAEYDSILKKLDK